MISWLKNLTTKVCESILSNASNMIFIYSFNFYFDADIIIIKGFEKHFRMKISDMKSE